MHNCSKLAELFLFNKILLHAHFAELGVQEEQIKFIMRTRSLEDAQGTHSHEEEEKGLNINLGNEETWSNGHRSRAKPMELIQTMKSLRMEVQSYKNDNEIIIRTQEEQKTY